MLIVMDVGPEIENSSFSLRFDLFETPWIFLVPSFAFLLWISRWFFLSPLLGLMGFSKLFGASQGFSWASHVFFWTALVFCGPFWEILPGDSLGFFGPPKLLGLLRAVLSFPRASLALHLGFLWASLGFLAAFLVSSDLVYAFRGFSWLFGAFPELPRASTSFSKLLCVSPWASPGFSGSSLEFFGLL